MKLGKLTLLLPAVALLAGCPGDDTSGSDTIADDTTGGGDGSMTTMPPTTMTPTTMGTGDTGMPDDGMPDDGMPDDGMPDDGMPDTGDTGMTDDGMTDDTGGSGTGFGDCTPIAPTDIVAPQQGIFGHVEEFLGMKDPDIVQFEFYTADNGMFDLTSAGVNDNYITCEQCVLAVEDPMTMKPPRLYFQSEGSITVSDASIVQGGVLEVTTEGVVLVEVTIAKDATSTPVEDGACVAIIDGTYTNLVDGWDCNPAFYEDGMFCDCGCGIADPDCMGDATVDACDSCNEVGSCDITGGGCPGIIDAADNAVCDMTPPAEWVCQAGAYGDGTCDCGCGAVDALDCADATVDSCEQCNEMGSCAEGEADCAMINMNNNAVCMGGGMCMDSSNAGELDAMDPTYARSFLDVDGMCQASATGTDTSYDVYTFTAAGGSTDVTLSTCNNAEFDSIIAVYQAPDGSADPFDPDNSCTNLFAYNDDNDGAGCMDNTSQLDVTGLVDGDYQVVVTSFFNGETGAYTLDLTCAAP
ncbi:MAG: hypothetical protein AAF721_12980 [Myxococcota bacterium]